MEFSQPQIPAIGAVISGKAAATCMSYHREGKRLFVISEADARMQVIDSVAGKPAQVPLRVDREQLRLVEATHHDHCVLFSGKGLSNQPPGQRNAINYYSVHDNKILRKFKGHQDKISCLSMCPADDTFLSSGDDRSVRLWNVQQAGCLAECKLPVEAAGGTLAVFDSTGLVFCVAARMNTGTGYYLHLYDARNFSAGAFAELKVLFDDLENAIDTHIIGSTSDQTAKLAKGNWSRLSFNQSGNQILVGADAGLSILLDGFEGTIQRVFWSKSLEPAVSCFSGDDAALIEGHDDGTIYCYNLKTGMMVKRLAGPVGPIGAIASNPANIQLASACKDVVLWTW
jgi:COMPASS component SWD2